MYMKLYLSWYKSRLYLSRYKRNEGKINKVLVIVWLKVWLEAMDESKSILGSRDH